MEDEELRSLQRLGEDTAYTFKGLYKESDWLERKYWLYLVFPGILSIVSIGFELELPRIALRILAIASLICLILALAEQKRLKSVDSYRNLANEIKAIYDRAEEAYIRKDVESSIILREHWTTLRNQTQKHPIGLVGRWLSKRRINEEMNLSWLGGEYK